MGSPIPTARLMRTCSRCKEKIPPERGAIHCTRSRPECAGAIYHYDCWRAHPCMQEQESDNA